MELDFIKIYENENYLVCDIFGDLKLKTKNRLVLVFKKIPLNSKRIKYIIYGNTINEDIDETLYDALRYPEYSYDYFYTEKNLESGKSKKIYPNNFLLEDEYTYKPYYENSSNSKDPEGPICKKYYDFTSKSMSDYLQKDTSNYIFYDIHEVIIRIIEKL